MAAFKIVVAVESISVSASESVLEAARTSLALGSRCSIDTLADDDDESRRPNTLSSSLFTDGFRTKMRFCKPFFLRRRPSCFPLLACRSCASSTASTAPAGDVPVRPPTKCRAWMSAKVCWWWCGYDFGLSCHESFSQNFRGQFCEMLLHSIIRVVLFNEIRMSWKA